MKKLVMTSVFALFAVACQKNNTQLVDQLAKMEKRIELLEQRLKAAPAAPKAEELQKQAFDIPTGKSYVLGDEKAPITLTQFTDFQCPFCVKAHHELVKKIQEDPELQKKVKIVFKHFPLSFHKNARSASKAALAAGEQGNEFFWAMTDVLYKKQNEGALSGELTPEIYKKWAGEVAKLNVEKFADDLSKKDEEYEKIIKNDMEIGAQDNKVRGTPTFFVNGWKLPARSIDGIKQIIKEKNLL